jgi:hypothetical protein
MAKINWQKDKERRTRYESIDYRDQYTNQYSIQDVRNTWQNSLWPIKGKYYGTRLRDLPLHYLKWVGMNFDIDSKGYKLVVQELECRTNKT